MMTVQLMFNDGVMVPFTNAICKYCGKKFFKTANKTCYCSDRCRNLALKEQKARYQRRRRKQIREGVLVTNENKYIGTNYLSQHCHKTEDGEVDEAKELEAIEKEMNRLKLRRNI